MSEQTSETMLTSDQLESTPVTGIITVHHSVIAAVARIAVLKVRGVHEMQTSFVDGLAGIIGKSTADMGIRVEENEQSVTISVQIVVDFGVRIPAVALQIQSDVRNAVENITGKKVQAVNVAIQDVYIAEPSELEGSAQ